MKKADPGGAVIVSALVVVLLISIFGFVGTWDVADEYIRGAEETEVRPKRVLSMPPADPIHERAGKLMYLTPPVSCQGRGGQQWIRQWGDGKLPPAIPTCVKAWRG